MWFVKYRGLPVQIDAHARSSTLLDRRAKRSEETLYVRPGNVWPRGAGEDGLQRPALLGVHAI
jgi:hypothetical protein